MAETSIFPSFSYFGPEARNLFRSRPMASQEMTEKNMKMATRPRTEILAKESLVGAKLL